MLDLEPARLVVVEDSHIGAGVAFLEIFLAEEVFLYGNCRCFYEVGQI